MSRWNVKASTLFLLGAVVCVMLVIVVLPDVDLLDAAFHRGTAPAVLHAQATAAPAAVSVALVAQVPLAEHAWTSLRLTEFRVPSPPNFLPILLRSIRC